MRRLEPIVSYPRAQIQTFAVTAAQMQAIEERLFAAGLPVAALMEKVAGRITQRIQDYLKLTPGRSTPVNVGILVGPGHNGGDALVVARELWFQGNTVVIYCPFSEHKPLTDAHLSYIKSLGIPIAQDVNTLENSDVLIDGLFGCGLERDITGDLATAIEQVNHWQKVVFSIDLPSGIHTDTGAVLGIAIRATRTLCLGLWKLAFLQDQALEFIGKPELIDVDIPLADIIPILGESPEISRITLKAVTQALPLPRDPASHKYKNGHLLIVAGSSRYAGAAILTGLGARASGVGMLTLAVPEAIKISINTQLPEALVLGCSTDSEGAMQALPADLDLSQYDAIACGPGLTRSPRRIVQMVLDSDCPLILDADGLNILAELNPMLTLAQRLALTIITPHPGEFKRLFPELIQDVNNRILATQTAAKISQSIVLLKGARVCVGSADKVWINPESTPALARGGSGDVLTGLLGGLLATTLQNQPLQNQSIVGVVQAAVWWHAQAGIQAAQNRTELGVDAFTLTQYLAPTLGTLV
ncbi:MAG: NAD(P)H-hydrate dehydratase [Microcoleaceae cyanobacterium]